MGCPGRSLEVVVGWEYPEGTQPPQGGCHIAQEQVGGQNVIKFSKERNQSSLITNKFPWKARGPATFELDYWRLSISPRISARLVTWHEICYRVILVEKNQSADMRNHRWKEGQGIVSNTSTVIKHATWKLIHFTRIVRNTSKIWISYEKAGRKRDPREKYLDELLS